MNTWEQIKKTLKQEGDKSIVVIENDTPYLVKKLNLKNTESDQVVADESEEINKDIERWNGSYGSEDSSEIEKESDVGEMKVEDLPF